MITTLKIYQKIAELIDYYESYLLKKEDATFNILIEEDTLSFYLSSDDKEDIFIIRFDEKDKNILYYLSLKIIIKIFGHVIMHLDNITLYNNVHKKNIKINILNNEVYNLVEKMIEVQEKDFISEELTFIKDINKRASKIYPSSFYKKLDERVNISKKMLKS